MRVDLIGVPFPIDDPLFKYDKKLCRIAIKIENLIEIKNDLQDCLSLWDVLNKINGNESEFAFLVGYEEFYKVCDALVSQSVMLYTKIFSETKGRIKLEKNIVFNESCDFEICEDHQFIIDFRNKHFAHEEYRLNKHQLFVLPFFSEMGIYAANISGQTNRIVLYRSFEWIRLYRVVNYLLDYVEFEITKYAERFNDALSKEQIQFFQQITRKI